MKFVDIVVRKEKSCNVVSKIYVGPYSGDNMLRKEFGDLERCARKNHLKTGKYIFMELDGPDTPGTRRRWEASLEVKGSRIDKTKLDSGIESKKLPAQLVASVLFDPDLVSSRIVYHGLECWLDWRKKYHEMEEAGPTREVYPSNPWTSSKAWKNTDVQVPVRRL
jgi:hypothetical protein